MNDTGLRLEGREVVNWQWVCHATGKRYRRRIVLGRFASQYWAARFFDAIGGRRER